MHTKPIIGILGGIGSGKSTVAKMFAERGAAVIDADRLAHEVLDQPAVIQQIKQKFGSAVVDTQGRIDRRKLADLAFDDKASLDFLNGIVHPRVIEKTEALIERYQRDSVGRSIVLDIPLLVEIGWQDRCDFLVFVECSLEKRLHRLSQKRQVTEEQLKKRENFQISLDKKAHLAHYKVNNNSDESEVAEQVAQIFSSITGSK